MMEHEATSGTRALLASSTLEGIVRHGHDKVDLRFRCSKGRESWVDVRVTPDDLEALVRDAQRVLHLLGI